MGRKAATLPNLQKIWGTGSPSLPPVETDLTPVGFPGRSTGFNDPCELNRFLGGEARHGEWGIRIRGGQKLASSSKEIAPCRNICDQKLPGETLRAPESW